MFICAPESLGRETGSVRGEEASAALCTTSLDASGFASRLITECKIKDREEIFPFSGVI